MEIFVNFLSIQANICNAFFENPIAALKVSIPILHTVELL